LFVERIFTRPIPVGAQVEHGRVSVVAGSGIQGDRYFGCDDEPGQNVTFIEAEELERFADEHGRDRELSLTGRNVVTRGVRLNDLVGREFSVGAVRFRGVELCEPCRNFGRALAGPDLSGARIVKLWVHRAGLRADALTSGEMYVGSKIEIAAAIDHA
jgi:MOSC domain-containing protein YiiM